MARPIPELAPVTSAFCPCSIRCGGTRGMTGFGRWESTAGMSMFVLSQNRDGSGWCRSADVAGTRLEKLGDEAGPAGLVPGADTASAVAVEVLEEEQVIAEVRILLQPRMLREDRPPPRFVLEEEPCEAARQLVGDALDRHQPARARRAFDTEVVTVIMVKLLQGLDDQ